jgi:ELWxxDGT repeat protein
MQDGPAARGPQCALGAALLFSLLALPAAGAPPVLVKDLGTVPFTIGDGRYPEVQAVLDGRAYFTSDDPFHGAELWRTDGTREGTERVADICPGRCSGTPEAITAALGGIFFTADDGATGREVWVSDGTREGTRLLKDLCPGGCSAFPTGIPDFRFAPVELGGEAFFAASDGTTGLELWKTDGTEEGTERLADVRPGLEGSNPGPLAVFRGALVFPADDGVNGRELWVSDGTAGGTRLGWDVDRGAPGSDPFLVAASGGHLLFTTRSGHFWTWNGTTAPGRFTEICPGFCSSLGAAHLGQDLIVVVQGPDSKSTLWRVNLASRGRLRLAEYSQFFGSIPMAPVGERVFFAAYDTASGYELRVTDGTPEGTRLVADLDPSGAPGAPFSSIPGDLTPLGNGILFSAYNPATGRELWTSDGTAAGTRLVRDIFPGLPEAIGSDSLLSGFVVLDSHVLFRARVPVNDEGLWRTDGTEAGTERIADTFHDPGSSSPRELTVWKDRLYFAANLQFGTSGIWSSDGTPGGTNLLQSFTAFPWGGPASLTPFGNHLYFSALEEGQLWRTDGTAAGTATVPGNSGGARELTVVGSSLYLLASPAGQGCYWNDCSEPHRLDGNATTLIKDINPGMVELFFPQISVPAGSYGFDLTALGNKLVFSAEDDGVAGAELWVSDGTAAGTVPIDLCPGGCPSYPWQLVRLGEQILFVTGGDSVRGLWRTDGTAAGTALLQAVGDIQEMVVAGDRAFFKVYRSAGDELWRSDGTAAGTVRVSDLAPGAAPVRLRHLTAFGNRVFFTAFHAETGEELWTSDGTAAGTRLVADVWPGPESSSPHVLTAVNDRLIFAATDGVSGVEPWTSDGTAAGTWRLADVAPGPDASDPDGFTAVGSLLYFAAADPVHGRELRTLPLSDLDRALCRPTDTALCLLGGRFAVTVRWKTGEGQGVGHALHRSDQTGLFWFFDEGNTELLVKMLDGGPVNGHSWFFSGALSDVEYWVDVRDLATGAIRTYHNRQGDLCGRVDTRAFPPAPDPAAFAAPLEAAPQPFSPAPPCTTSPGTLCLGGQFLVHVTFKNPLAGDAETLAEAIPGSSDTGYFWFFDEANFELAVKILDGTPVNGRRWVFWGALSDVEYTVHVLDTGTGQQKSYRNPRGRVCGGADTSAF